jgi:hypothetical protein
MEINLNLGLVSAQFDESSIELDAENRVNGVLTFTGVVDAEWVEAFELSAPLDAPWRLEGTQALRYGPIPPRDLVGCLASLRDQIKQANESVQDERHRRAMAAYIDEQERARAYQQAIDALSSVFGRRLSTVEDSPRQAA